MLHKFCYRGLPEGVQNILQSFGADHMKISKISNTEV